MTCQCYVHNFSALPSGGQMESMIAGLNLRKRNSQIHMRFNFTVCYFKPCLSLTAYAGYVSCRGLIFSSVIQANFVATYKGILTVTFEEWLSANILS